MFAAVPTDVCPVLAVSTLVRLHVSVCVSQSHMLAELLTGTSGVSAQVLPGPRSHRRSRGGEPAAPSGGTVNSLPVCLQRALLTERRTTLLKHNPYCFLLVHFNILLLTISFDHIISYHFVSCHYILSYFLPLHFSTFFHSFLINILYNTISCYYIKI